MQLYKKITTVISMLLIIFIFSITSLTVYAEDDGEVVNNDALEETQGGDGSGSDIGLQVETDKDPQNDSVEETQGATNGESQKGEEDLKEGGIDLSDKGISGSGYDEISIFINTENLDTESRFKVIFVGSASASYSPVLNDELEKSQGGKYDFEDMEGGDFRIYATSSDDVIISYKYNEDGYPEIYIESIPDEDDKEGNSVNSSNSGGGINVGTNEGTNKGTSKDSSEGAKDGSGEGSNENPSGAPATAKSGEWKSDSSGWWYQYTDGSFAKDKWENICGNWYYFESSGYMSTGWKQISDKWYYFCSDGAMAYSEYRDGCWLDSDGSWNTAYSCGNWRGNDADGWWYEDNGWYPVNESLWIDGKRYQFNESGYCTNPY